MQWYLTIWKPNQLKPSDAISGPRSVSTFTSRHQAINFYWSSVRSCGTCMKAISREISDISILVMTVKICNLTYLPRVPHICVSRSGQRWFIWTNDGILLFGPLGINFSEILIDIYTYLLEKNVIEDIFWKQRPFGIGFNVLRLYLYFSRAVTLVKICHGYIFALSSWQHI